MAPNPASLASPFDLLSPDVLEAILEKTLDAESRSSRLGELASLNRDFRAATHRMSRTFIICKREGEPLIKTWKAKAHGVWLRGHLKKRPNMVNLRVEEDMPGGLAAVLSELQWERVELEKGCSIEVSMRILSGSESTLRSLKLAGKTQCRLTKVVPFLLEEFLALEELRLCGTFKIDNHPDLSEAQLARMRNEEEAGLLRRLGLSCLDTAYVSDYVSESIFPKCDKKHVLGCVGILLHVPASRLSALRFLRIRCAASFCAFLTESRSRFLLPSLEVLDLQLDCGAMHPDRLGLNEVVQAAAKACPSLTCLKLSDCSSGSVDRLKVQPIDIPSALKSCPKLAALRKPCGQPESPA